MAILSLGEIPELQKKLQPCGYKIHIHDACGGQSFSLEAVGEDQNNEVYNIIDDFFAAHKMKVEFYNKAKTEFTAR